MTTPTWPARYDLAAGALLGHDRTAAPDDQAVLDAYNLIQRSRLGEYFAEGDPGLSAVCAYLAIGDRWTFMLDTARSRVEAAARG